MSENQSTNTTNCPNHALNLLLHKKSKMNLVGSVSWKAFLFPSLEKITSVPQDTKQYFGLDLVEEKTERTVWTHKPSVWSDLFESVQDMAKNGQAVSISDMFDKILACPMRSSPKGPNEPQTFKSAKGQNIQHWILLVPSPVDRDISKYVQEFISTFQDLCQKPFIRYAYKAGVCAITTHLNLNNQISQDGSYWSVVDTATKKPQIINHYECLSDVLLNSTINHIVPLMFDVENDPDTWSDFIKTYAFGN